jgi:CheY-like chemotaxis protein
MIVAALFVRLAGRCNMTRRVLLVEDQTLLAMLAGDLLLDIDCEPVLAVTAREALALIAQGPAFDLAVVNLKNPDGDGTTVIRALWERWPVPVIVSTGYEYMLWDEREALMPYAAPIVTISKPWSNAAFLDLARRFLSQAQKTAT